LAAEDATRYPFEISEPVDIANHPLALALLAPFIVIFAWAAWLEFRRWWIYGPVADKRAAFPIDTTAPGYDLPERDLPDRNDDNDDSEQGTRK